MVIYHNDLPDVPKAIGPYSQAAQTGTTVFLSGQVPIEPSTGKLVEGEIHEQIEQVMKNLSCVLAGLNLSFANVVKTTILLKDMAHFPVVNEIYQRWLGEARPARATFQVAGLPLGALVEIEMIAEQES